MRFHGYGELRVMDNWDMQLIEHASMLWRPEWKTVNQKCGELNKKATGEYLLTIGTFRKTWSKRFFILKDDHLFYFKKRTDAEPAGLLFLEPSLSIEYFQANSFLQDSFCLRLTVPTSCSLENRKCYRGREYVFACASDGEAREWKAAIEKAIAAPPALKNREAVLSKGDSSSKEAMVISQPVLISKKTFSVPKSIRRNSVSSDLKMCESGQMSASFIPSSEMSASFVRSAEMSASFNPRSADSHLSDSSRRTFLSDRSYSAKFRGSSSGLIDSSESKFSLNVLICKSMADLIRSFLTILRKLELKIEDEKSEEDDEDEEDESQLNYLSLLQGVVEELEEDLRDMESEVIPQQAFQTLCSAIKELSSSTCSYSSFLNSDLILDEICKRILMSISEIVKQQAKFLEAIPSTPCSIENDFKIVEKILSREEEESNTDLILTTDNFIKGASLERLIERLTFHTSIDARFLYSFLLTFRKFCTPQKLLDLLIARYNMTLPEGLSVQQLELYRSKKIIPIRLRVLNLLKSWVKTNFQDFTPELLEKLKSLLPVMRADFRKGTEDFEALLERQRVSDSSKKQEENPSPSPSLSPISPSISSWTCLAPADIAKQMTLIEWNHFCLIKPSECLDQSWNQKETQHKSPNIMALIKHLNYIVYWIGTEITSHASVKMRAASIKQFILVAEKCRQINNFNALMAILAGLNTTAISRLKKSWELIPSKLKASFDSLNDLMSEAKGFKNYRQQLAITEPPCIPFLGVYLTNLVFIEGGNKDFLAAGIINFDKCHKVAKIIEEIVSFQKVPFNFEKSDEIQRSILNQIVKKEEEIYERSIELEPR